MREPWWVLGLLLVSGFLTAGHGTAGVIEERRALMLAIAGDLQEIWLGLARQDRGVIEKGAERIAAQAARVPTLFPPESFHPPSRAQPAIRTEFRTFEALALNLERTAQDVAVSARKDSLRDVRPTLERLVQACRLCHRSYIRPY